jgi:hypothetical protein
VWAHIIIEHELEEFVRLAAPEPSQLKFSEMDYSAKVKLALVLGLNSDLKPALNAAGSLRNNFSHRLEMKIGEQEAKNLFATLTPNHLKALRGFYPIIFENKGGAKFQDASARDRVQMFFVMIFSHLFVERHSLEDEG